MSQSNQSSLLFHGHRFRCFAGALLLGGRKIFKRKKKKNGKSYPALRAHTQSHEHTHTLEIGAHQWIGITLRGWEAFPLKVVGVYNQTHFHFFHLLCRCLNHKKTCRSYMVQAGCRSLPGKKANRRRKNVSSVVFYGIFFSFH